MGAIKKPASSTSSPAPAVQPGAPKPYLGPAFANPNLTTEEKVKAYAAEQAAMPHAIDQASQKLLSDQDYGNLYNQNAGAGALAALHNQRSGESQAIISQAMNQAHGLNGSDLNGLRQNALASVNSQNLGALHQLRGQQAANGVRGGLAQAQLAQQGAQASGNLQTAEQGLITTQLAASQKGLQNAATIVGNQENIEKNQAADRLSAILSGRGSAQQLTAAQLQAQAASSGGGGKF